jgi:hypothetical protein
MGDYRDTPYRVFFDEFVVARGLDDDPATWSSSDLADWRRSYRVWARRHPDPLPRD